MFNAFDASDPDPKKRELASVQLVDELFGPGLLDRLAKQEGREARLREVRERALLLELLRPLEEGAPRAARGGTRPAR